MKNLHKILAPLWADALVDAKFLFLQSYLTVVWKLSFTHAAAIVNFWEGAHRVLQVVFLFLADAFLGILMVQVFSGIAFLLGIWFVFISIPPVLGTCKKYKPECIGDTQKILFYTGMLLLAVGRAGRLGTLASFNKEQRLAASATSNSSIASQTVGITSATSTSSIREETTVGTSATLNTSTSYRGERKHERLIIKAFYVLITLTMVVGFFAFPYIKSWLLLFVVPAVGVTVAILMFFSGCGSYVEKEPRGSPLTVVFRVLVAAALKRSAPIPHDEQQFYTGDDEKRQPISRTPSLRCLEKAAIILRDCGSLEDQVRKRWRLCSVAEVEDAKTALRMVPVWIIFMIYGLISSIANTYLLEQAAHMDLRLEKWKVPAQILALVLMYPKFLYEYAIWTDANEKPLDSYPDKIGVAGGGAFCCCIAAAIVEMMRLKVSRRHGLLNRPDETVPMSAYWLLFPMLFLGMLKAFLESAADEFHETESPKSMKQYRGCFSEGVTGLGYMCSVLSVYAVGKASEVGGNPNWFQFTLNRSHLDRYYWVLAVLSFVTAMAAYYTFRKPEETESDIEEASISETESVDDVDYRKWWHFVRELFFKENFITKFPSCGGLLEN